MTTKSELLKMIRMNCSLCMGAWGKKLPVENPSDIEGCTSIKCVFFEYRFGKDPYPSKARQQIGRNLGEMHRSGL